MAFGQFSSLVTFSNETQKDVDVSSGVQDATKSVPALFDGSGNQVLFQLQAISATTVRIFSEAPVTGTYRLVVLGEAPVVPPAPAPFVRGATPPTLGQLRIFKELRDKLEVDLDLQDETFVTPNELIGYFNEGIEEAESEILKIDEDYFLTSAPVLLVAGQAAYPYPANIYAYKVRGVVYANGSVIYSVKRFRRKNKFERLAFAAQYSGTEDYMWYPTNDTPGSPTFNLMPPARETATDTFQPMTMEYIRHANRIPLMGQYIFNWEILADQGDIDITTDQIPVTSTYVTGDKVKLSSPGSLPAPLVIGTEYYVIKGSGYIKLATTLQNALAGTAIDLTAVGTGQISIAIAASQAIIDNTVIDIPEFTKFVVQWAKCRCMEKEGDPRLQGATETLVQQRAQMVSTLTEAQPDDQNEIEPDFSAYTEMA